MGRLRMYMLLLSMAFLPPLMAQDTTPMYWQLDFSNDLLNQTDRYYTQGLQFIYSSPSLSNIQSRIWLPGSTQPGTNTASCYLMQDLYTPSVYNLNVYNPSDRPYCGVLAGGYRYLHESESKKQVILSSYLTGVVGKYALGQATQNGIHDIIHNLEALGWSYQIQNGFLLNASYTLYRQFISKNAFSAWGLSSLQAGTYKDNVKAGIMLQWGNAPKIDEFALGQKSNTKFKQSLQFHSKITWVWHDATLQGALFQDDDFGFAYNQLMPFTWYNELKYRCLFSDFTLELSQKMISPEFKGAFWHKWVTLSLARQF